MILILPFAILSDFHLFSIKSNQERNSVLNDYNEFDYQSKPEPALFITGYIILRLSQK